MHNNTELHLKICCFNMKWRKIQDPGRKNWIIISNETNRNNQLYIQTFNMAARGGAGFRLLKHYLDTPLESCRLPDLI